MARLASSGSRTTVLALVSLLIGGLSTATSAPRALAALVAKATPTAPDAVGLTACTFRDPSRSAYDYATGTTTAGRILVTEIRYPVTVHGGAGRPMATGEVRDARAGVDRAPYPTIFFAPGYDLSPDAYEALLDAWVRAGFVVVAPLFPDTNPAAVAAARYGDPEDDIVNQPADMAFLVRQVLAATRASIVGCAVLHGLVDAREIAVAGQSDGGETVAALAYDHSPGYASLGVGLGLRAAVVMSGGELGSGPFATSPGAPALLVVQSSTDQCNPPQYSTELYEAIAQRDKWFLDLEDADHLPPYTGEDPQAFAAVARVTTRFFLLELSGRTPAAGFLAYGDAAPTVARISTGSEAPPIAPLEQSSAACYAS